MSRNRETPDSTLKPQIALTLGQLWRPPPTSKAEPSPTCRQPLSSSRTTGGGESPAFVQAVTPLSWLGPQPPCAFVMQRPATPPERVILLCSKALLTLFPLLVALILDTVPESQGTRDPGFYPCCSSSPCLSAYSP
jgi:hypothetical protein